MSSENVPMGNAVKSSAWPGKCIPKRQSVASGTLRFAGNGFPGKRGVGQTPFRRQSCGEGGGNGGSTYSPSASRLCKTSPQRLEAATLSARARLAGPEIVCPSLLEPAVRGSTAISEVRACVAISTRGSTERALGISIEWPQGLTWRSLTVRRKCGETQRLLLLPSTWRARVPPARRLKVPLWVRKLAQASPHPRQRLATIARPYGGREHRVANGLPLIRIICQVAVGVRYSLLSCGCREAKLGAQELGARTQTVRSAGITSNAHTTVVGVHYLWFAGVGVLGNEIAPLLVPEEVRCSTLDLDRVPSACPHDLDHALRETRTATNGEGVDTTLYFGQRIRGDVADTLSTASRSRRRTDWSAEGFACNETYCKMGNAGLLLAR
eukprot:1130254-Prymnesium_polylepis.1